MGMSLQNRRMLPYAVLALASAAAMPAIAGDFVFGEDFEGVPACAGTGFVIGATPAAQTGSLGTQHHYLVKTRACGVSGAVTLGQSGAPASWTRTLDPNSLTLANDTVGVALLTVTVPTNADGGLGTFDLSATNNAVTVYGSATLDVANEWILHFAPDGTGADASLHQFPPSLTMKVGAKIRLISDDTTAYHIIHADGGGGLVHQNTGGPGLSAGQEYDMTLTGPTSTPGHIYCHSDPGPATVVTVQP
jgi:hypothetical protein